MQAGPLPPYLCAGSQGPGVSWVSAPAAGPGSRGAPGCSDAGR